MSPYKSTAADRIAQTEARLGRKVWAASELPDDLARALWWKRRRWYFDARRHDLASDDPAVIGAESEYYEALIQHELLIFEMLSRRIAAQEAKAWDALASVGIALNAMRETIDA